MFASPVKYDIRPLNFIALAVFCYLQITIIFRKKEMQLVCKMMGKIPFGVATFTGKLKNIGLFSEIK